MQPPDAVVHDCPRLDLQLPLLSQVPAQLSLSSAFLTCVQLPPGPEHFWQVPPQSLSLQQALFAMQAPLHGLKPEAQPDTMHVLVDVSHCLAIPFCAGQSLFEQQPSPGMHFEPHFFIDPQLKPHWLPSQVAVPPAGTWQGSQEPPQVSTDELETQAPRHMCCWLVHVGPEPAVPCEEPAAPGEEPAAPGEEPAVPEGSTGPCVEPAVPSGSTVPCEDPAAPCEGLPWPGAEPPAEDEKPPPDGPPTVVDVVPPVPAPPGRAPPVLFELLPALPALAARSVAR